MNLPAGIVIRPANTTDLAEILQIDPLAESSRDRRESIQSAVTAGFCHIAEKDTIQGFTVLDYSFYGNGFISLLVVRPDCRRQGVASELVKYLESFCTTSKLFTSTNESNLPMQALLEKLCFQPSGIIYGLDEGDPELIFHKTLKHKTERE
jgi:ribosomal protein S18 acetylase RimI-like enzyme